MGASYGVLRRRAGRMLGCAQDLPPQDRHSSAGRLNGRSRRPADAAGPSLGCAQRPVPASCGRRRCRRPHSFASRRFRRFAKNGLGSQLRIHGPHQSWSCPAALMPGGGTVLSGGTQAAQSVFIWPLPLLAGQQKPPGISTHKLTLIVTWGCAECKGGYSEIFRNGAAQGFTGCAEAGPGPPHGAPASGPPG